MNYLEQIEQNKDAMLQTLKELISIRSVVEDPEGDSPFGKGVQQAFDYMLALGNKEGFATKNVDNYGGHLEWKGQGQGIMAIAGHLDVVPEGNDWDYDPFGGEIVDGKIYGRGTLDDKGPTIAAFYAMKALKDSGFQPKKDIRMILGLDEETSWSGMNYYMERETVPDMGFIPDADFPAIHCEKGLEIFNLKKQVSDTGASGRLTLVLLEGGNADNMVPDWAKVKISASDESLLDDVVTKAEAYKGKSSYDLSWSRISGELELSTKGVSCHSAWPEKGLNAISILMEFLAMVSFDKEDMNRLVEFYNAHVGFDYNGDRLGVALEDEPSGKLTHNVGIIKVDQNEICLTVNIRYPATKEAADVYGGISPVIAPYGLETETLDHLDPIYVPKDDPLVVTLMDVYREFTGDKESQPLAIGGATYARAVPNSVAFGALFPGEPDLDHQRNEYISIEKLVLATKIFAEAIYRLTK